MSRAGILIFLVFILAVVAVALFYIRHGYVSEVPVSGFPSGENLFEQSVVTPDITFSYPKEFGLAIQEEEVVTTSYIPPCSPGFDYCLYYSALTYAGTNFDAAGLRLQRRHDLTDMTACMVTPPAGFESVVPITQSFENYSVSLFLALGEAGAGHYATGKLYRLFSGDVCYEFETRIGASQYANYEPGTVREFTENDQILLEGELQSIVESLTFTRSQEKIRFPR